MQKKNKIQMQYLLKIVIKSKGREKKNNNNEIQKHHRAINKISIGTYQSIINLNVNILNTTIKNQRMVKWIKIRKTHMNVAIEIHFRSKDT